LTTETLKTTKRKHDESLLDYVKHFYNVRNVILNIQDIEIINVFHDGGVTEIKIVEEIVMKMTKTVADLLPVANEWIEASKGQARLLDTRNKGSLMKKQQ
jgi:hypothetical protein